MNKIKEWTLGNLSSESSRWRQQQAQRCLLFLSLDHCNNNNNQEKHRQGGLNNIYFLQFWRLEVQDQDVGQFGSWSRLSSEPADGHLLIGDRRLCVSSSSAKGTNSLLGAPPSWPQLNLILSQRPHVQVPSHEGLGFYMWMWGKNKHWAISAGWGWVWCVWGDSEKVHWNWAWVSNGETGGRCIQRGDSWKQIMSSFVGRGRETFHVLTRSCEPVGQGHPDHCISPFPLPWACSPRLLVSKCCQSFLSVLHNVLLVGKG